MKKFLIILLVLLSGCATTQRDYIPQQSIIDRLNPLFAKVSNLMEVKPIFRVYNTMEQTAWADEYEGFSRVNLTEGMLRYDDDALTFILAHELSHIKLEHIRSRRTASLGVTGVMMVVGFIIPGAGILNHAINPAVVNNFSKTHELEADKLASETCVKLGIPISKQVETMNTLRNISRNGGGFWDQHPSWDDRINHITATPSLP